MTPRQRRVLNHATGAVGVVALIVGAVVGVDWLSEPVDPTAGIDDVLARVLPDDVPHVEFLETTAQAGIDFRHFTGLRTQQLPEDMGPGLAWGDCDGDGWTDLYGVSFGGPLDTPAGNRADWPRSQLYRNRGDGTFDNVSAASGADQGVFGLGASWADYDADGDLDLYVTRYGPNTLFRNDGNCRFTDATAPTGLTGAASDFSAGATWADYDLDGDIDLYVTNYVQFEEGDGRHAESLQFGQAVPFTLNPASYSPAPNRLFRNDGGTFTEVAADAGVANPEGRSLSATWADFDQDGLPDLYVANDISDNAFYRNLGGGRFEDISAATLTADYRGAMGIAVTDFDRDGDSDFFVTHWIAQENGLYANHLEFGLEGLMFADVAEMMGLGYTALDYVGWGTEFIDYDNDGHKDLFVANGHTLQDSDDPSRLEAQRMQLFWWRDDEGFYDATDAAGEPFQRRFVGRGAAAADYDGDGNIDVAMAENGGGLVLLRNTGSGTGHWVSFSLAQPGGNTSALGARIAVTAGGVMQTHVVGSSPSYLSHNDLKVHFGLGTAAQIDRVSVVWPDGGQEHWPDLDGDRHHRLERGSGR